MRTASERERRWKTEAEDREGQRRTGDSPVQCEEDRRSRQQRRCRRLDSKEPQLRERVCPVSVAAGIFKARSRVTGVAALKGEAFGCDATWPRPPVLSPPAHLFLDRPPTPHFLIQLVFLSSRFYVTTLCISREGINSK